MSDNVLFGVVTNTADEEKLGRVKVKLMAYGAEIELPWIRVMQPMGGKGSKDASYGTFWIPEKDDQVVILQGPGGIDGMVVLGCLYEGKTNKPPFTKDNADNNIKQLITRAGNELTFDDTDGKEKIHLQTKEAKIKIEFDAKEGKLTIQAEKEILLESADTTLNINAKDITITAAADVKIDAGSNNVEITGGKITITGSSKVVIGSKVELG